METMDRWEAQLEGFDATVARVPERGITVTVYAPGDLALFDALSKMQGEVPHIVDSEPVGVEIVTEAEHRRRADYYTMPELMSAAEIAEELGVSRQRVHQLRSTTGFPEPLADLRGGAVWDAAAVRKFAETWERRPGRPRLITVHGIPSAEQFGRPTLTLIDPTSENEADVVRWRIENPTKNHFVLRNVGNNAAENVEVDVSRIDAITRDMPSGASVQPGEGIDLLLVPAWGRPLPNQLYVRWAGLDSWTAVPLVPTY